MPRLILVKHAMPTIDPAVPAGLWRLSDQGRVDALRLAEALAAFEPDRVFSSTEPKAAETARIVAERLDLLHEERPDLHEHDRRGVGFLGEEAFQDAVARFFQRPGELVMGAETAEEAGARFEEAVDTSLREAVRDAAAMAAQQPSPARREAGTVVIVAHGTVISLYLARKAGIEPHGVWKRLGLPSYVVIGLPAFEPITIVDRLPTVS